jgi:Protein of unknown function (DUF2721)
MSAEAITRTIQLILAPVVMLSACSIFVGGVLSHYTSLSDRIRALTRERLDVVRALCTLPGGPAEAGVIGLERLEEIDGQLPDLLRRHRLVHHAALAVYAAIGILIGTMCIIALTATISADWVAVLVFGVFIASVLMMLLGVLLITVEIRASRRALQYEVQRVRRLAARSETVAVADGLTARTVQA